MNLFKVCFIGYKQLIASLIGDKNDIFDLCNLLEDKKIPFKVMSIPTGFYCQPIDFGWGGFEFWLANDARFQG